MQVLERSHRSRPPPSAKPRALGPDRAAAIPARGRSEEDPALGEAKGRVGDRGASRNPLSLVHVEVSTRVRLDSSEEEERQIRAVEVAGGTPLVFPGRAQGVASALRGREAALALDRMARHPGRRAVGCETRERASSEPLDLSERMLHRRIWRKRELDKPPNQGLGAAFRFGRPGVGRTWLLVREGSHDRAVDEERIQRAGQMPLPKSCKELAELEQRQNRAVGLRRSGEPG